jgi:hypothetical protein
MSTATRLLLLSQHPNAYQVRGVIANASHREVANFAARTDIEISQLFSGSNDSAHAFICERAIATDVQCDELRGGTGEFDQQLITELVIVADIEITQVRETTDEGLRTQAENRSDSTREK